MRGKDGRREEGTNDSAKTSGFDLIRRDNRADRGMQRAGYQDARIRDGKVRDMQNLRKCTRRKRFT
jgi:hypothetical protein